jgi:hypothetical protein
MRLTIPKVADFAVTGDGNNASWNAAGWQKLTRAGAGASNYETKAKVLCSESGIYFLVDCEDRVLHCTLAADNLDLYNEDVVEVFLWPDEARTLYFEYEISPLGYELPLLVPNHDGDFYGWLPWHHEGGRRIQKATAVRGGRKASRADVRGWTTEFYIPFCLLKGMGNVPPSRGAQWRGNLCRLDYDTLPRSHWTWSPGTGDEFHRFQGFGTFVFG